MIMQEIGIISIPGKQRECTKQSTGLYYKWATSAPLIFLSPTLWTADINETQVGLSKSDAYHQVYITNSNTQPAASILFNKVLDKHACPQAQDFTNTSLLMNALQIQGSKGYLQRQHEHGTYTVINMKAANFPFSPYVDIQKRAKRQEQGENDIPYQTWMLDTTCFRATLVWR